MSKTKILTALCAGVVVFSSIVPVSANSSSVTSSLLNSQELSQVKALQTEIQNLTNDTSSTNSGSAKASALSVNQGVLTSYTQKLKDNVNKVGEAKVKQLVKKYVVNQNTKPSITDKAFLRLSKAEQVAVISYVLPVGMSSSYTKTILNTQSTVTSNAKVSALSVQASGISNQQYCYVYTGTYLVTNLGGNSGNVLGKLTDKYVMCYTPTKYLVNSGNVVSGYPDRLSYISVNKWIDDGRKPSCNYTGGSISHMNCSSVNDFFSGLDLWGNFIGIRAYFESGFNINGSGDGNSYAKRI